MFATLLVANRGEIARRILRTASRLGIETVAVYSDADAEAPFVREADRALRIGPPPPAESYLRIDAIIEAALRSGAEAVHPGYGFLAENAEFAEACARAGLVFVGPPPEAIRAMGAKDRAKALMAAAGVPVVPGYHGEDQSDRRLAAAADEIGYPVLVKAVAGGGGKGMRAARTARELRDALLSARREAKAAFGDDRVLIEKLVGAPRHIEVQVFGDAHGNVIHLYERDCSLQRRHQKVIEEAPAPGMTAKMRAAMCDAAIAAAKAVGYVNAGTVELIVDGRKGLRPDAFWFMEMNTRLQVEHPVTEMITGLDLVELQLRVAAGESLPRQEEIALSGHAIEARIYAEDPTTGFLPSSGPLAIFDLTAFTDESKGGGAQEDATLRLDSGVEQGDAVRPHYDPLLAKGIAWARTRDEAAFALQSALASSRIWPVRTNVGFLARTLPHEDFRAGRVSTSFIDERIAALAAPIPPADAAGLGALVEAIEREDLGRGALDPWDAGDGWRLNGPERGTSAFEIDGVRWDAAVLSEGAGLVRIRLGEDERRAALVEVEGAGYGEGELSLSMEGGPLDVSYARVSDRLVLFVNGDMVELAPPSGDGRAAALEAGDDIAAPMPGRVLEVRAAVGQSLAAGDVVLVLEAMKMEHALKAPRAGVLAEVRVAAGDQVGLGDTLARLAALEPP